jgi:putative membrane protein
MVQQQQELTPVPAHNDDTSGEKPGKSGKAKHGTVSKNVSDHLANERTFLAWIRTGLATITFGFVVERFNLLLRELGLKSGQQSTSTIHYSAVIGVMLTIFGVLIMVVALLSFLRTRRAIDEDQFRPPAVFAIVLTSLACVIGIVLAVYLVFNAG